MGNQASSNDPDAERSRIKLEEQNKLLREQLKNQQLNNQLSVLQNLLEKQRIDSVIQGRSPNQLLTNPNLQQEFMKNKQMQREFLEMLKKQTDLQITQEQYAKINQYLEQLDVEELETDAKKSHLYMNESSGRYEREPRKLDIGNTISDQEKFIRQLKKQKQQQEKEMSQERERRKEEYANQLKSMMGDNINPYQILEISENATLSQMKKAFKNKARIYHPDRLGGNTQQFQLITKAFMMLLEKYKKQQADKQFMTLKEESKKELERQQQENKRHVKFKKINMSGRNFNSKKFNKIYEDNRLYNPNDEGYKDWMDEEDYNSLKVPKLDKNNYQPESFNQQFQKFKKSSSKQIVKRTDPQALPSLKVNCEELGQDNIGDFSGKDSRGKIEYTDYRKAHTETTLIDPDSVDYREYDNLDDIQRERGKKLFLTQEELEQIKMNEMLEKQREEQRMNRLRQNDDRAFQQFERVNQMFLQ